MATSAHTCPRAAGCRRHTPDRCSTGAEQRPWPDGAQLWGWAEAVLRLGYGPAASFFA